MIVRLSYRTMLAALPVVTGLMIGSRAVAQETTPTVGNGLSEIIVTARRQSEFLQKTPVAITAVTGETIDKLNIQQVDKLGAIAPNLAITEQTASVSASTIHIRGIGEQNPILTSESGVGLYLDGVYVARTSGAIFDLVDMERIEVLRGPQGTLFGRNTTGGAIQLVSRKPANEMGGQIKAGYGSFNDWYSKLRFDTGSFANDMLKASFVYNHRNRDGFVDNALTPDDEDPGSLESDAFRGVLVADIGKLQATYSFDYNKRQGSPQFFQLVAGTPDVLSYYGASASLGGAPFMVSDVYQKNVLRTEGQVTPRQTSVSEISGHALTLEYQLNDALTLKSISAYRSLDVDFIFGDSGNGDLKGVVLDPVTFAPSIQSVSPIQGFQNDRQEQWSQEIQLLGRTDHFKYVVGAFYFKEDVDTESNQFLTFVLPGGAAAANLRPRQTFGATSESFAGFAQISYRPPSFDDRLEFTGGVRYTRDSKSLNAINPVALTGDDTFNNTSWLASVSYDLTSKVMIYGRATTGYKSGGFNPSAPFVNSYKPEEALAFEGGLKSRWLDNRLQVNLAIFKTDYDELQTQQFVAGSGGSQSIFVNAGKAEYQGIELEVQAKPFDGLSIDGSLGYTDAEYARFDYRDPVTNVVTDVADDARFPYLAKVNAHVGAEYAWDVSIGKASARLDYSYRSGRDFHPVPLATQFMDEIRDHGQRDLSARLGIADIQVGGSQMEISVWGANLLDRADINSGIDFGALGFAGVSYVQPQRFGVDLKATF